MRADVRHGRRCGNGGGGELQLRGGRSSAVLPYLLRTVQRFSSTALVQEHGCGTLAAMALRRPANARTILDAGGPRFVLAAMRRHDANVSVQCQGSLAIRNIFSRLLRDTPSSEGAASGGGALPSASGAENGSNECGAVRDAFLELGAEDVLHNVA